MAGKTKKSGSPVYARENLNGVKMDVIKNPKKDPDIIWYGDKSKKKKK